MSNNCINIAFMNIHGQSSLDESKQVQIENFIKSYKIDILNCQEINMDENSFKNIVLSHPRILQLSTMLKTNMESFVLFPTTLIFKM